MVVRSEKAPERSGPFAYLAHRSNGALSGLVRFAGPMRPLALLVLLAACVNTQATQLAGFDPTRRPTCAEVIRVYASGASIGAEFVEIAYLEASASDPVGNDKLIANMKEKAAAMGANGLVIQGFSSKMGGPGLVTSAFVAKPVGQALAVWIPRDSLAAQKCPPPGAVAAPVTPNSSHSPR